MKITGIDYTDPSLIAPWDDAHHRPIRRAPCSRCRGDGVLPCSECFGHGSYCVDGEPVKCNAKGCDGGLQPCFECDSYGVEV